MAQKYAELTTYHGPAQIEYAEQIMFHATCDGIRASLNLRAYKHPLTPTTSTTSTNVILIASMRADAPANNLQKTLQHQQPIASIPCTFASGVSAATIVPMLRDG